MRDARRPSRDRATLDDADVEIGMTRGRRRVAPPEWVRRITERTLAFGVGGWVIGCLMTGAAAQSQVRIEVDPPAAEPAGQPHDIGILIERSSLEAPLTGRLTVYREVIGPSGRSGYASQVQGGDLGIRIGRPITVELGPSESEVRITVDPAEIPLDRPGLYPWELEVTDANGEVARARGHLNVVAPDLDPIPVGVILDLEVGADDRVDVDAAGELVMADDRRSRLTEWLRIASTTEASANLTVVVAGSTLEAIASTPEGEAALAKARDSSWAVVDQPYLPTDVAAHLTEASGASGRLLQRQFRANLAAVTRLLDRRPTGGIDVITGPDPGTDPGGSISTRASFDAARIPWWEERSALLVASPAQVITLPDDELAGPRPVEGTAVSVVLADSALDSILRTDPADPDPSARIGEVLGELGVRHHIAPNRERSVALVLGADMDPDVGRELLEALAESPIVDLRSVRDLPATDNSVELVATTTSPRPELASATDSRSARLDALDSSLTASEGVTTARRQVLGLGPGQGAEFESELAALDAAVTSLTPDLRVPTGQTFRLTSRRAEIPVRLVNTGDQPVEVLLRLDDPRIALGDDEDDVRLSLEPGATTVELAVRLRGSGAFTSEVELVTPSGDVVVGSGRIEVSSTVVSGVGWIISGLAAAVLLAWWARDLSRGQRDRRLLDIAETESGSTAQQATASNHPSAELSGGNPPSQASSESETEPGQVARIPRRDPDDPDSGPSSS